MATFKTTQDRSVPHCHVKANPQAPCESREFTRAQRRENRAHLFALFPNVVEVRAPSRKYNCHGYSFTHAHGWFNEPDLCIDDDFSEIPMANARRGDVLVYQDDTGEFTHSGFVKRVNGGQIEIVRSKWGKSAAVLHDPLDVDESYGQPTRLLRRNG
jgi:hypothetical protein